MMQCMPLFLLVFCILRLMQRGIFFFGSQSASNVPFGFVSVQHLLDGLSKRLVDADNPLGHVFMYG